MGTNGTAIESVFQRVMLELAGCGFAPLGDCYTQGSGLIGRALSADGMTWADITVPRSDLRANWRYMLKTGVLRGTGWSAQRSTNSCTADGFAAVRFSTLFNDGSSLVTAGDGALADLALRHMQGLDSRLLLQHPLKALILVDGLEVEAAARRLLTQSPLGRQQPLDPAQLRQLGIPAHLAELIGGACATAEEPIADDRSGAFINL